MTGQSCLPAPDASLKGQYVRVSGNGTELPGQRPAWFAAWERSDFWVALPDVAH